MVTDYVMEPSNRIVRFLRHHIIDYNAENRTGRAFINPDFPRKLPSSLNDYPFVTTTLLNENGNDMGMYDADTWDEMSFQIDVFTKDKLLLDVGNDFSTIVVDTSTYPANRTVAFTMKATDYL